MNERSPEEDIDPPRSGLLLGPLIRRSSELGFAVWVEVAKEARVTVTVHPLAEPAGAGPSQSFSDDTFCVGGHHYAIVDVDGLEHGECYAYEIELDTGEVVWPDPDLDLPPSQVQMWQPDTPFRISGGSCRQQAPQDRRKRRSFLRRSASPVTDELGADALAALAHEIQEGHRERPHLLMLSGDQVYADERHEVMTTELEERRGGPPKDGWPQITSFEEYTWLYERTWAHPLVRWLLSSVPSVMIFDDHDVIDDWNISDTWADDIAAEPWWTARLESSLMAYWVHQHLGNLSREERADDELYQRVRSADDGQAALCEFASNAGTGAGRQEVSWSYRVTAGPIQVVVLDGRNGRVLEPGRRSMLSPRDWDFLDEALDDDPNVLIVSSVPWLLPPGVHHLERFVSQLVGGRWGARVARWAEKLRRSIDLEHWAAFGSSVDQLTERLRASVDANGRRFPPVVFSGDVHFAYLAQQPLEHGVSAFQLVSSPMRQGDANYEQVARWTAMTSAFDTTMRRLLARGLRRKASPCAHRVLAGIWTDNNIASLVYSGDGVHVRLDAADLTEDGLVLHPLLERDLS